MRSHRTITSLALAVLGGALALAQQPAPPAINPAQARADGVAGGLDGPGTAVVYDEATGVLLAACEKGTLHAWDKDVAMGVRAGDRPPRRRDGHEGQVLALAQAGDRVASGGSDGKVKIWDLSADKPLFTLDGGKMVRALAAAPEGKVVASVGDDRIVHLWDPQTGKEVQKLAGATDWLLAVAFSPDGKAVAAGGFDGRLRTWELATAKKLLDLDARPPAPMGAAPPPANVVSAIAFSPDGKLIAVGGDDTQVHLFQAADGKFVRSLPGHTSTVTALAFHPGGALLVSASKDRTVRLWNPAAGQLLKTLEGHNAWVQGVTFAGHGTRLASVSADQTVRLWDLTEPPKK